MLVLALDQLLELVHVLVSQNQNPLFLLLLLGPADLSLFLVRDHIHRLLLFDVVVIVGQFGLSDVRQVLVPSLANLVQEPVNGIKELGISEIVLVPKSLVLGDSSHEVSRSKADNEQDHSPALLPISPIAKGGFIVELRELVVLDDTGLVECSLVEW